MLHKSLKLSFRYIILIGLAIVLCCVLVGLCVKLGFEVAHSIGAGSPATELPLHQYTPKCGDLIMFSSGQMSVFDAIRHGSWVSVLSHIAQWVTQSGFLHTGIVYVNPSNQHAYLWEFTIDDGVVLSPLWRRLQRRRGHVTIRRILPEPVSAEHLLELIEQFPHDHAQYNNQFLMYGFNRMFRYFRIPSKIERKHLLFSCLMFVVYIYDQLGILQLDASVHGPSDTTVVNKDFLNPNESLPLRNGYRFGDAVRLV